MAAFANSEGGTLFIGVTDDGSILGLTSKRQIEASL
ncbi:MAG: ATP-binding protein [Desulfobulbaceae bacterium]|nr:ATP-binding protein [Desulfobulbaceae bacterium]